MNNIFTIGYSSFVLEDFYNTLVQYGIKAVADVRSSPYSKIYFDFNRNNVEKYLKSKSVYYVFLGEECGARTDEEKCFVDGVVDFSLVAKLSKFQSGIDRILQGAERFAIALMCAEKDPATCHRAILVSRALRQKDVVVRHILADRSIETQVELEKRLLKLHKLDQAHMFKTSDELLDEAYERQGKKIAYRASDEDGQFSEENHD